MVVGGHAASSSLIAVVSLTSMFSRSTWCSWNDYVFRNTTRKKSSSHKQVLADLANRSVKRIVIRKIRTTVAWITGHGQDTSFPTQTLSNLCTLPILWLGKKFKVILRGTELYYYFSNSLLAMKLPLVQTVKKVNRNMRKRYVLYLIVLFV